jgi:hypothetical protein
MIWGGGVSVSRGVGEALFKYTFKYPDLSFYKRNTNDSIPFCSIFIYLHANLTA